MEHSKLPWVSENWGSNCITLREEGVSEYIAQFDVANNRDRNLANAAFIVQACNAHYDLMGLLENVLKGVDIDLDSCQSLYNEIKGDK